MSRLRALVLIVSTVAACRTTPSATGLTVASRCLIADTSSATADTIYAFGHAMRAATVDCERRPVAVAEAPAIIAITPPTGVDLRDLLEGRAGSTRRPDVTLTADPRVIEYARRSAGFVVEPLPWNTTYVLTVATRDSVAAPEPAERDALARHAVSGDARGASEPFPWRANASCLVAAGDDRPSTPPTVGYSSGDPMARAIAERIVSLAGSAVPPAWLAPVARSRGGRVHVAAFEDASAAVAQGRATAAVVAVRRDPTTSCGTRDNVTVPRGAVPLVDARQHVIVRRGSGAAFVVGADGALHFVKRGVR